MHFIIGDNGRGGGTSRSGERPNSRNDNFGRLDYDKSDKGNVSRSRGQNVEFTAHSSG